MGVYVVAGAVVQVLQLFVLLEVQLLCGSSTAPPPPPLFGQAQTLGFLRGLHSHDEVWYKDASLQLGTELGLPWSSLRQRAGMS